jgi:hypothetical protein
VVKYKLDADFVVKHMLVFYFILVFVDSFVAKYKLNFDFVGNFVVKHTLVVDFVMVFVDKIMVEVDNIQDDSFVDIK